MAVEKQTDEPKAVPQDYRAGMVTRVEKDGSTTYIPESMYEQELNLVRSGNRLTCAGLVAGGLGLCAAIGAGSLAALEFIRGCGNENVMRALAGFNQISTLQCVEEGIRWIPLTFRHFLSW